MPIAIAIVLVANVRVTPVIETVTLSVASTQMWAEFKVYFMSFIKDQILIFHELLVPGTFWQERIVGNLCEIIALRYSTSQEIMSSKNEL